MKTAIAVLAFSSALLFVACGESTTENVTQINEMGMDVVKSIKDLPKCTSENQGEQAFVKGETSARICVDGKWFATVASDSSADMTCTTKALKDKSGVKIICGGDSVGVVLNGKNGTDGKDGKNGVDGKDGTDGVDGKDGAQGIQGEKGDKGDSGSDGKDGTNGTSCTAVTLKDNSGLKILCGGDSVGVVLNGQDGAKGDPGESGTPGTPGEEGQPGAGCSVISKECILHVACGTDTVSLDVVSSEDACREIAEIDSEKIAVSLDEVSGVTQKGPFLMGSRMLVREMEDGRTLTQTGGTFNGKILNDNGEFKINARMLVSQYVMLEATGYYRNEVTGKNSSSELTLFAITDVNERNIVNVNLLTHLEYDRVIYLVTQKKLKVRDAKKQAQTEVFGLLNIDATKFSNSEDLNIAGSSDEDGALLAYSLMFQGDRSAADLTVLLQTISNDMKEDGTWDDKGTRMEIAEWSADADSSGKLAEIRKNVEGWGLSLKVPNFEQFVRNFWNIEYGLDSCNAKYENVVKAASAGKRADTKTRYICKDDGAGLLRWQIASDIEKDTYQWKDSTDGALKNGDVTGKVYVFDSTGSFNGTAGWREAESIEKQYGGCREALFDSIRTDKVYAYYYTCKESLHTWVREVDYLLIDTQYWPDSTDGKVKWGDSIGVATPGDRICYVWDDAAQYRGWRTGNTSDCTLGLLGCTAKRGGEMRKATSGRYYSCSNNEWVEISDDVYINTYLYRCTIDGEGERVYKEGDLVYGIEKNTTRYACENEQWRDTKASEEQAGKACTRKLQGFIQGDSITCDAREWRPSIFYDYPVDKDWTNPELTYGTLEDKRDGRTYKIIDINGITVMAQNLVYSDSIKSPYLKGQSECYQNDTINCLKGGRYYRWTAAMNIDAKWNEASPYMVDGLIKTPHQGICPDGWHIPTNDEWEKLYKGFDWSAQQAKGILKWKKATNASGFSALPTSYDGSLTFARDFATFWSASERNEKQADYWAVASDNAGISINLLHLTYKHQHSHSVRCFKDSTEP